MAEAGSVYSDIVRQHVVNPRNRGELIDADGMGQTQNPVCGDVMSFWIKAKNGLIQTARFDVSGCAPCVATGSVLTEMILGKDVAAADNLSSEQLNDALGGLPAGKAHCLVLALQALKLAIANHTMQKAH